MNSSISVAYWTGTDASSAAQHPGPEINDFSQLLDAVRRGGAVAYVPISLADQHRSADLAFVPVSDPCPSEVLAAWLPGCLAGRQPLAHRGLRPHRRQGRRSPRHPRPPLEPQFE